jgi:hypothetical protein
VICLLRGHHWRLIGTVPHMDVSFGQRMPRTILIRCCRRCGKLSDRKTVTGTWTVEQLTR